METSSARLTIGALPLGPVGESKVPLTLRIKGKKEQHFCFTTVV